MPKQQKQQLAGTYGPIKVGIIDDIPSDWDFRVSTGEVKRSEIKAVLEISVSDRGYTAKQIYFAPDKLSDDLEIVETSKTFYHLSKAKAKNLIEAFRGKRQESVEFTAGNPEPGHP